MSITRRNILKGTIATAAVATIPMATVQADDADVHATVAAWHAAYRAYMEAMAWDQAMLADPKNDPDARKNVKVTAILSSVWSASDSVRVTRNPVET